MIACRFRAIAICALTGLLLPSPIPEPPCVADDSLPLIDQEPFDRITLTPDQKSPPLLVFPLADEGTQVPDTPKPDDKLRLRLIDYPDKEFEIEFRYIAEIERFEDVLLEEAKSLVTAGKFEEAFNYYQRLQQDFPRLAGLNAGIEEFLLRNAAAAFRESRLREALGLLEELQQRNPRRPELPAAIKSVVTRLFEQDIDGRHYAAARLTRAWVRRRFPGQGLEPLVARWQAQLEEVAEQQLRAARDRLSAEDWRGARRAAQFADAALPNQPETVALLREINVAYPIIVVGVWQSAPGPEDSVPLEWSSRRLQRLVRRSLVEQSGFGSDGGRYGSPFGIVEPSLAGDSLRFTLELPPADYHHVTAFDISLRFLDGRLTERSSAVREIAQINVLNPRQLEFQLRQATLRPEYVLTEPLSTLDETTDAFAWSRPYRRKPEEEQPREQDFVINNEYLSADSGMFREVHEYHVQDPKQLLRGLMDGEYDLVTRVHPADVRALQRVGTVATANYASPTLHFLLPNFQRPRPAHRNLRRGLLYCVDRDAILSLEVLGSANSEGARVLNGPFPFGVSLDDPLAYAVDSQIPTRVFDPLLGKTLYRLATSEVVAQERAIPNPADDEARPASDDQADGKTDEPARPADPLRIVFPDQARARITVDAIRRYWSAVGIPVETQVIRENSPLPDDSEWDFCYLEFVMTEPLHDIHRLLGEFGLVRDVSPYLRLALRQLRECQTWEDARRELYEVHRLVHEELPVLPLWQVLDTMAYRRALRGIPQRPLTMYQDVENWRMDARPAQQE